MPRLSRVYASGLELPRLAIRDERSTAGRSGTETPFLQQVSRKARLQSRRTVLATVYSIGHFPPTVRGSRLSGLDGGRDSPGVEGAGPSPATTAPLRRVGLALGAAERTGPGDDPSLRPERLEGRAEAQRAAAPHVLYARGLPMSVGPRHLAELEEVSTAVLVQAALERNAVSLSAAHRQFKPKQQLADSRTELVGYVIDGDRTSAQCAAPELLSDPGQSGETVRARRWCLRRILACLSSRPYSERRRARRSALAPTVSRSVRPSPLRSGWRSWPTRCTAPR